MQITVGHIPIIVGALLIFSLVGWVLGFNAGMSKGKLIALYWSRQAHVIERQRHDLIVWVRERWPTEYRAYHHGIEEGYQQGLNQAPAYYDEVETGEGA